MYVADFYNRIIGHYEVPLHHPGRDRERGRIWRVVYQGSDSNSPAARQPGQPRTPKLPADFDALLAELGSPSLPRRMLAMNELADRFGSGSEAGLRKVLA